MAALGSQSIASSYEQLLHTDADGGGNGATLVSIKDGDNGTTFALQMSTDKVYVNGSVGIGVNDPDSELELYHATDPQIKLSINTHGDAGIMLGDADGMKLYGKGSSNELRFYSGTTLKGRFDSNGLNLDSGRIQFPATQSASSDANTLDDYEQGTHTATITPSTSGTVTLDSSYQTISYTKIGDIVHIGGNLVIGSVSSPVGTYVRISSPFTNNNGHQTSPRWNGSGRRWNGSAWSEVWTTMTENVAGIDVVLDASTLATNHQIRFAVTYKAIG